MSNQDQDWLDGRLGAQKYISDDGFTGRVVDQLPASRPRPVRTLRSYILFVSTCFAACVGLSLLIMEIGPLAETFHRALSRDSFAESLNHLAAVVQQPGVLRGGAIGIVLLGVAAIPFLRRWV
jgi:hypothetical protein